MKPSLSAEPRWYTIRDTLAYYEAHWPKLAEIVGPLLKPSNKICQYVENMQLRRPVADLLEVHGILGHTLNKMQSCSSTISNAVYTWRELIERLKDKQAPKNVLEIVRKRGDQALSDPVFMAAYFVDNRFVQDLFLFNSLSIVTETILFYFASHIRLVFTRPYQYGIYGSDYIK